jgi:hypothetical protein
MSASEVLSVDYTVLEPQAILRIGGLTGEDASRSRPAPEPQCLGRKVSQLALCQAIYLAQTALILPC